MSIRDEVTQALQTLGERDLYDVADYLAYLRFRARAHEARPSDAEEAAPQYALWEAEDRNLAEEGFGEYSKGHATEDVR